jgi:predicted nucleic acid-binding protein
MAPTPGSAVFLDTNILVYASFPGTPFYHAARARLGELERDGVSFCADDVAAVTAILLDLLKSRTVQGKQIHDANIVATMRRCGISSLLTHHTADFTRYVPDISDCPYTE